MIKIETGNGIIMAEAVIEGIPVNPVDLPSMEFINPHRRGEVQAERIWIRRPWIATRPDGYEVYHLGPSSYRPDLWGRFETLQQAVDYITTPPPPHISSDWSDEDMNF